MNRTAFLQTKTAILLGVFLLGVSLHSTAEIFTIEHLPALKSAGNLSLSNNGDITAYTLSVQRDILTGDEDGSARSQLFIITEDEQPKMFIEQDSSISNLQFSSDDSSLYFKTKREDDDHSSIYKISLSGGEAQKIFEFETNIGDFYVTDDEQILYFVAKEKDSREDLSDKGFKAYAYEEDQQLASIYKTGLNSGATETDNEDSEPEKLFSEGHVSNLIVSDDEKILLAAVAPTSLVDDSLMKRDIYVLDASSGELETLIDVPGKLGKFIIAEDNETIAFLAGTDIHDTLFGVLMLGSIDDSSYTQLTPDAEQHILDIDWLDDDILALAHRGVESELLVYDQDGNEDKTLSIPDDIVVRSVAVSSEGRNQTIRFTADSPSYPVEVFAFNRNRAEKLSNHNAWLEGIELAEQTTFIYSARDSMQIEGLLITPPGDAPEKGWPLILKVHGGPEAHYSDGWLTNYGSPGQFAAAKGYAVYHPNYRGSTGRGVAFSKQHQNDYAGKEFNDLTDAVDALAEAGIIDKDRVGITGGSYGGYASMWGATAQSDYFAASVAFVGISNQVSKFGTSDIPNEMHLVHSLKWPWEDWMNLIERSPIYHAGNSTTPTLILHGENDTRVHPSQSMELYRAIKLRTDTPVRLIFYPNEGHGNRNAAARYDYALRMMRWMDTYLAEDANRDDPLPPTDLGIAEKLKPDTEE